MNIEKHKVVAKEILNGKFWIIEEDGKNVATISYNDEKYMLSDQSGTRFFESQRQLKKTLGSDVTWAALKMAKEYTKEVHGYPTSCQPYNPIFDVKRKLPLFTKSSKSKSLYCAGYYVIHFEKGWVKSFCPKLITVERYENKGPFRTEIEMRQELSRVNTK
jgi:hypothetical protein